jgi:hypothetical protein
MLAWEAAGTDGDAEAAVGLGSVITAMTAAYLSSSQLRLLYGPWESLFLAAATLGAAVAGRQG